MSKRTKTWMALMAAMLAACCMIGCADAPEVLPDVRTTRPQPLTVTQRPDSLLDVPEDRTQGFSTAREDRCTIALHNLDDFNLNPFLASTFRRFPVDPTGFYQPIYQTLCGFDTASRRYVPRLARSIVIADHDLILQLDPETHWHDGYPLTEEDVIYTMQSHRALGTELGQTLEAYVDSVTAQDDWTVTLTIADEHNLAIDRVLDACTHLLIVPKHIWLPYIGGDTAPETLDVHAIGVIGTGPWAYVEEDTYALTMRRVPADSPSDMPKECVLVKYRTPHLAGHALRNEDIDLLFGVGSLDDVLHLPTLEVHPGVPAPIETVYAGEQLMGITINPAHHTLLRRRPVRQVLTLLADREAARDALAPHASIVPATHVLTIPTAMQTLNLEAAEAAVPSGAGTVNELLSAAQLSLNATTGLLDDRETPSAPLRLMYPADMARVERACEAYVERVREVGFDLSLQKVSREVWERALRAGKYDLIYTETAIAESMVDAIDRVERIPGIGDPVAGLMPQQFNGGRARQLIDALNEGARTTDSASLLEELAAWMVEECVFIPLAAGDAHVALWSQSVMEDCAFDTFISHDVKTYPATPDDQDA